MKNRFRHCLSEVSEETKEFVDDYAYNLIFFSKLETRETFNGILIKICNLCEI